MESLEEYKKRLSQMTAVQLLNEWDKVMAKIRKCYAGRMM